MADSKRSGKTKIAQDPIVGRVLGDEHKPISGVVCIGGFVGESPLANHVRLFTKMDFSECLDIPDDAVVHQEKVEKPGIPGGTYVWVKRRANLALTVVDPVGELSTFLQGPILRHSSARKMKSRAAAAGFFSTPICSIIVSLATVSLVVCTHIHCPEPTGDGDDECPDTPEPITFPCPTIGCEPE
jgi:hypothetical protein